MTDKRRFVAAAAAVLMLSSISAATAEESPAIEPAAAPARAARKHSLDLGIGILGGAAGLTYEYGWTHDRGLVLEAHRLDLPANEHGRMGIGGVIGLALAVSGVTERSDDSSWGVGVAIGHRWHWRRQGRTGFYGLHAGIDLARSHNYAEATPVEHGMLYMVGNAGQRWRMSGNFHITARIGVGVAYRFYADENEREYAWSVRLLDELVDELPITLDGELSVGYAF
jgi:murein DD-endopeptidase MepM/ murein hydrolase activator NlpD